MSRALRPSRVPRPVGAVVVLALVLGIVAPAGAATGDDPAGPPPGPAVPEFDSSDPAGDAVDVVPPVAPPAPPPPPELPPPPPFPLALDAGTDAIERIETADAARRLQVVAVARLTPQREELAETITRLENRAERARAARDEAVRELAERHDRLQVVAADVYMYGSSVRISSALKAIQTSDNLVDASRTMRIVDAYGTAEVDGMRAATTRHDRLVRILDEVAGDLETARARFDAVRDRLAAAARGATQATAALEQARVDLEAFHDAAVDAGSPILGPTLLDADDLAAFVLDLGFRPELSVPLEELAAIFVEEADALGVRGDVAWVQSILETGFFTYPGRGKVQPLDNNWAGIGACDSCERGRIFADAREGARAQMQLLRTYVDAEWPPADYEEVLLLPRSLGLGFRGEVQTWFDLGGKWATGPNYGYAIFRLYQQMRDHAAARAPVVAAAVPGGS